MKLFLDKIRAPRKGAPLKIQIIGTVGIVLMGFALGVLQKWIDGSPDNRIGISFAAIFMAYICWYAKGEGIIPIILSSGIIGILLAQAFSLTQGFYVYDVMEVFTWIAGVIILHRKPKEFAVELGLSVVVAVAYQLLV